ncbi:MAG: TfoX/Sxy family protein [Aurantimonas endophytica]|uniref:DNA transformation protein n=1 Tax=Aurantimonas endophytica TaxID=1522175 RepID=A0A7W6MN91_9HYPH|nr:TfoX/Sxy family protein [Aurantimonas endophytica]MBB4001638.1 DNA transformation protein [Aurantimonas endophytica]MCO6402725.1 competence protein TfoX [Aurantimonas endophytica]
MDEDYLHDLFASLGDTRIRRMFSGQGIYSGERIVAIVIRDELYLKSDAETDGLFEAVGSARWTYTRPGRAPTRMPYFRIPDSALDDPDEAARWIEVANAASRRAAAAPRSRSKRARNAVADRASS